MPSNACTALWAADADKVTRWWASCDGDGDGDGLGFVSLKNRGWRMWLVPVPRVPRLLLYCTVLDIRKKRLSVALLVSAPNARKVPEKQSQAS